MRRHRFFQPLMGTLAITAALALASPWAAAGDDWTQYRGSHRDGQSAETGLALAWPAEGPRELWRARLGTGYSGMTVAAGRLFTLFGDGEHEHLVAFDAASGRELWRQRTDRDRFDSFGRGPRSTPAVDGGRVYALSALGKLYSVEAADGAIRWKRDLVQDFGARVPQWGVSSSPAIEGDLLLLAVGGRAGHSLVAFHKASGEVVWASGDEAPSYSTALVANLAGVSQAIFMTASAAVSARLADGEILWRWPWKTSYQVNAAMPLHVPPDRVLLSSGYGQGALLLEARRRGDGVAVAEVWSSNVMQNHFNSSVRIAGHLYGFDNGILKCISAQTGEERWKARGFAKGSLLYADGHLIVLGERGQLAVVEATPEEYREKARTQLLNAKTWTMPTLADRRLFVRSEGELVALDLAAK